MTLITHHGETAPADTAHGRPAPAPGRDLDRREDIVIERLDRSLAYAIPTWCSTSPE